MIDSNSLFFDISESLDNSNFIDLIKENELYIYLNENWSDLKMQVEFLFVSSSEMIDYNNQFLNHNYDTDILTFNLSTDNSFIIGQCILSINKINENAVDYNESLESELNRVIYHGLLHLIGYNDETKNDKVVMRDLENKYLKYLNL
jgi:rRNA maturation RNase YbeY